MTDVIELGDITISVAFKAIKNVHLTVHPPDGQVSLVAMQEDSSLAWCEPTIAYLRWDTGPLVRRVVRWVVWQVPISR